MRKLKQTSALVMLEVPMIEDLIVVGLLAITSKEHFRELEPHHVFISGGLGLPAGLFA